jgi:hypothetical protein
MPSPAQQQQNLKKNESIHPSINPLD